MQEVVVVGRVKQPPNLHHRLDWLGRSTVRSTLQCQEGFSCSTVRNTALCLPVCGSWKESPCDVVLAIDVVIIFVSSCWFCCLHSSVCHYMHTMGANVSLIEVMLALK